MKWFSFKLKKTPKSFLGIDIGTSSIKVVELGRKGQTIKLINYGEVKTASLQKSPFRIVERDGLLLSDREIAAAISAIFKEAGIESREANFSIPDFSSFFTTFELPPMSQKELESAVKYEARSYIPLPLSEIALDWTIIEGKVSDKTKGNLGILAVAIPNEVINQYQEIASLSGLQIKAL
jgi:type IV pilus assembly protein PilM